MRKNDTNQAAWGNLQRLYKTQKIINALLQISLKDIALEEVLQQSIELILSAPEIEIKSMGGIFLVEEPETLVLTAHKNLSEELLKVCAKVPFSRCLCGLAASSGKLIHADHVDERHTTSYEGMKPHGHYCVPIIYREKILGAIVLYLEEGHQRKESDEEFLHAAANTLAGIIVRRQDEKRYAQLFEQAACGILVSDSEHNILDANKEAMRILGYSYQEITRLNAIDLIDPKDLESSTLEENIQRMASEDSFIIERRFRKKDGEFIPVQIGLRNLKGIKPSGSHMVMFHDITKRRQAEERMQYLAYFDELTGLPNRELFLNRLQQAMVRTKRFSSRLGVMLVDIDRLKDVNNTLGSLAGDKLIQEIGRRINNLVRETDTVARTADDEFMVLLEDIDYVARVQKIGKRTREKATEPYNLLGTEISPEISIGYTVYPDNANDLETLLKQTNMAMYEAKKSAFSRVRGFVEQEDRVSREFYLEHDLKRALENDEFVLFYQPQVALKDNQVIGLEALLRWQHPEKGLVSPGDFIPILEKTGLIVPASQWLIRKVCNQIKDWQQQGLSLRVSVNISAHHFDSPDLIKTTREALNEVRLDPRYLGMEITESTVMQNVSGAVKILEDLSRWGVKVALDDFGKGYSSLSYLQQLAIHTIKIDRYFVYDVPENRQNTTLVQTIVTMAHNLGKEVLAEGVEREEQARILRELGCDYAQGFLFGRPQPSEELNLCF